MGSYTPNYNLYKPAIGEVGWGDEINTSTDTVDATLTSLAAVSHVAVTAGVGIDVTGQLVTNTDPDQTVAITGGTNVTIGGTYPNFTITDNSQTADAGLTSLAGLTYSAPAFVKLTGAETFTLDTTLYLPQALTNTYIFVGNGSGVAAGVQMSGDVTITNAGVTTVAISLDDLTDVTIASPVTDHILRYNGSTWVNGPETTVNGGSGVDYFFDTTASDISGYETLAKAPQNVVEQDLTAVCNNNTVLMEEFASASTGIGGTQIDAGVWTFDVYAYCDLLTLPSNVQIDIYKSVAGVETLLFTVNTPTLTSSQALYSIISIQQAFPINATDRLVAKVSGVTTNVSNTTIHFAFGGTSHYSHINSPLVTRHNDLAGLQGGSGTERYHLTSAQVSALHDAVTSGTGIGVVGQVVSLNHLGLQSLTDPNADRLMIWDDVDGSMQWVTIGAGLTYTHATHTLATSGVSASVATMNFVIDGGGEAITTGVKGDIVFDFACTINQVTLLADQSGSIVVDIWKDSYANFPPTVADTITAAAKPTISAATKSQDNTLTGWTTSIAAGEILRFNVDSASTILRTTLSLKVTRT